MKISQATRILKVLDDERGEWINGRHFNDRMRISQYHARIHKLQSEGYKIIASDFKDEFGFKSYKLESKVGVPPYPIMHNEKKELETLSQEGMFGKAPIIKKCHQDMEK